MQKSIFIGLFFIAAACVLGVWMFKGDLFKENQVTEESKKISSQLKDLYGQSEEMECEIRALQSEGKEYDSEQKALGTLRESIESIRSEISTAAPPAGINENKKSGAPRSVSGKLITELLALSPRYLLGIFTIIVGAIFFIVVKNKIFGSGQQKHIAKGFQPSVPLVRHAQKQQQVRQPLSPEATEKIAEAVKQMQQKRQTPVEQQAPSPVQDRIESNGMINDKVLTLARGGLSVKDISSQLKIGQDQVTLVLKLHNIKG
jgi:hypothetical protein